MNIELFDKKHNEQLIKAVDNIISNNRRIKIKVIKELMKYKNTRMKPKNKLQERLQYISIQKIKESLQIDLAIQLLNYRINQFIHWFKYIMSRKLTLTSLTHTRYKKKFPYSKTGVGRVVNVIF